jgi:CRISPR-associated protein Cas1
MLVNTKITRTFFYSRNSLNMIKRTLLLAKPSYVSTSNQQLKISFVSDEEDDAMVPIEDIGLVLLENQQITITNGALNKLMEHKVVLVQCDSRHMPNGIMLPMEGNTLLSERYRIQLNASVPLRKSLWKQTVQAKLFNQARVLESVGANFAPLDRWRMKVLSGDTGCLEARGASYYWPRVMKDKDFRRDPHGEIPNHFFNYAYAILRATIARALVSSGLLPAMGIFHRNKYNAFCLADDVMEPYRPFADNLVLSLISNNGNDVGELDTQAKRHLLQVPALDVHIEGKKSPLWVAASRTSNSLFECFEGSRKKILYPEYGTFQD